MRRCFTLVFAFFSSQLFSQALVTPDARWTTKLWDANWIAPQGNSTAVVYFRKSFTLPEKPHRFIIHLSADSRYRLFINGHYAGEGPQISDLRHYRFESLDISELLNAGKNTIAAEVWNLGEEAPVYQMGKRLALIVQGNDSLSAVVNSDKTWKYQPEPNITPIHFGPGNPDLYYHYYAAGPMDKVSAGVLWDWEKPGFNDSAWKTAVQLQRGTPFLKSEYGDAQWELMPRSIPAMERTYQSFGAVRKASGSVKPASVGNLTITVPPNQRLSLLLDQRQMTTAFPEIITSKGKGSEIKVTYAESIYDDPKNKGHRDSVNAKIHGVYDLFYPDGGPERKFTTLSYRAFRYVQLDITTGAEPLTVQKIGSWFTGYPFKKEGMFKASDPDLEKVFDIGWHTERLCSYETYMDCPYWERLQYIGDTRIQALVSYYVAGDDRLARNAISQFEWSITYDGLTGSRYPSALPQYIPNYSLVWVLMVHDYMMYRNDPEFVKSFLPGIRRVLEHFKQYLTQDYMMQQQPYWDFIDHTFSTKKVVDASLFKKLTTNSLFYSYTLSRAADIFGYFNDNTQAQEYAVLSQRIKESVKKQCWDANSEMYADTPDKKSFSMHSNILAVLCGMMPREEQEKLLKRIVSNKGITQTTLYFDFYLARAMSQAGTGGLYYDMLSKWKDLLNQGLTTFPEGVSRSDCHAWSASPDFEMAATLAGIEPQAPGFKRVIVRPQLQKLTSVEAKVPHWAGEIKVVFEKSGRVLSGSVTLPPGINGRLEWGDKSVELLPGTNEIKVE